MVSRLLCALEGKYLAQDSCHDLTDGADVANAAIQRLSFSCYIPNVSGRGFIEVGSSNHASNFFPFGNFLFSKVKYVYYVFIYFVKLWGLLL